MGGVGGLKLALGSQVTNVPVVLLGSGCGGRIGIELIIERLTSRGSSTKHIALAVSSRLTHA